MLQTVIDISGHVSSALDPKEILYLIVCNISEIIPGTRCSIIGVDGSRRYAHVISTFEDPHLTNIRLDLNKYPEIREALTSKKPVAIKNAAKDPLMKRVSEILFPLGIRPILVIPIIFHEEIIGTLFLRTSRARHHMRKSDVVARYGGEEFIVLLPQTDENGALAKAESLRSHIESHPFRGLKGERGPTVSIGLATHPDHRAANKEDLITLSDNALYSVKALGRNRVVASKP